MFIVIAGAFRGNITKTVLTHFYGRIFKDKKLKQFIFHMHIAEPNNWYITPDPLLINSNQGIGGFAPFEYFGILKGIAVCTFLFIGFDVTSAGNRWKSIYGIVSFIFGTLAMIGIGTVVTLAQPFYLLVSVFDLIFNFRRDIV